MDASAFDGVRNGIRREKQRRLAERSLLEFTRQAWPIVEPSADFVNNWHIEAICDHLEAVSRGEIKRLLINVPPGCMKSLLVCVMWPAWEWARDASLRYLAASYSEDLSIRDALKTRDIITSDWYREAWPQVRIKRGEDQKTKYAIDGGGWRLSTSVAGRGTGEHPDRKIVDDPHNVKQAASDAEREQAITWLDQTLSSRGVTRDAATVVIMQRLHQKDVSGHILEDIGGYDHLCLPMEYEGNKCHTVLNFEDPRSVEGSLLWPELYDEEKVATLSKALGAYGAAGQLQQRPSPAGGGVLQIAFFELWNADWQIPAFDFVLQSYDGAYTEKTQNDPTACTAYGFFQWQGRRRVMLVDAWAEHMSYPDLRQRVIDDWSATYGGDPSAAKVFGMVRSKPRRPDEILIEEKAVGLSLIQDLRQAFIPAQGYNPGRADKVSRAHQVAPILESGCIFIPESRKERGQFISWARPFIQQCERFPNDEHDDLVDTFTQAMIRARDLRLFELPEAKEDPVEERDYRTERKRRTNPYGV